MPKIQRDNDLENSKPVENNLPVNEASQTSKLSGNLSRIIISMFIFGMGSLFFYFLLSRWLTRVKEQEQLKRANDKAALADEHLITPGAKQMGFQPTIDEFISLKELNKFTSIKSNLETEVNIKYRAEKNSQAESVFVSNYLQTNMDMNYRPVGPEFVVTNSSASGNQTAPRVATLTDGSFVIAWQYGAIIDGPGLNGVGIYAKKYTPNGTTIVSEFRVDSDWRYPKPIKEAADIAKLQDGGFIIVWQSLYQDGSGYGIYAQRFYADGKKFDGEFLVNTYTKDNQALPAVTGLQDGGFVITWQSMNQDKFDGWSIYAKRYTKQSIMIGDEFRVGIGTMNVTSHASTYPRVAGFNNGGFAVVWEVTADPRESATGKEGVYIRLYSADGEALGEPVQVNNYLYYKWPDIAVLKNDGFIITWTGYNHKDNWSYDVFEQRCIVDSKPVCSKELRVNKQTPGQRRSKVAVLSDDQFVITWQSDGQYDSDKRLKRGIYAQRYSAKGIPATLDNELIAANNHSLIPVVGALENSAYVIIWANEFMDKDGYSGLGINAQRYEMFNITPTPTTVTPTTTLVPTMTPTVTPTPEPTPNPGNVMQILLISATGGVITIAILGGIGAGIYLCKRMNQYSRGINEEAELDEEDLTFGDNFSNKRQLTNILTCCGLFRSSTSRRDHRELPLEDITDNTNRSIATVTNATF